MIYRKIDKLSCGVMYPIALASLNGVGGCVAGNSRWLFIQKI